MRRWHDCGRSHDWSVIDCLAPERATNVARASASWCVGAGHVALSAQGLVDRTQAQRPMHGDRRRNANLSSRRQHDTHLGAR